MTKNRLLINHVGDSVHLSWQRGQAVPLFAPPVTFEHPFNEQTLASLRWYLEEYLRFPYGIEPEKAAKVEQKFQVWGQQLFDLVFRSSEKAQEFFQEATRERLEYCEIGIASDDPTVLNLPWELLYSPDYQFLAPSLAGMYRSLSSFAVRAEMPEMPQDKLNILLVIARPYGEQDITLKTIARPMLEALKPIRNRVNLKVLRPPSFEQFERELNAHKGFYHIVHFDGHGNFDPSSVGFQHSFGESGQGVLVFESVDGSPQIVTAAQIAQSLTDCGVPIFVLNACKSAQEGGCSFSSVATRLVSLRAKGVVAMSYSVYAEAAKQFIGRLYEQLVEGVNLSNAVAAARRQVLNQRLRPSPKGDLSLQDWVVPVLYQQETYTPFTPLTIDTDDVPDIDKLLEPTATNLVELPKEGAYGFIGRDYDILRLERAFRQNNIVLLQGMGGVGKTELACSFARWLEDTQGRAGLTFFMSFERGAGLVNVVNQVGRAVWGEDLFSQYLTEKQRTAVLQYLRTKPYLLIWDNFESVAGFPLGNEPLLPDDERDSLKRFLNELRGGQTWVLITSRREEIWLDCGYRLLNLKGLVEQDVEELAAKILQTAGVDRAKLPKEYLELLKLLGGHPLSLRVVLPHLNTQNPIQLIDALRRGLDTFKGAEEEGRDKSLTVSLDYSFAKLSARARQHLPFLAFFSELVNASLLHMFLLGEVSEIFPQTYQAVFGESLYISDWIEVFNEATDAGILEHLSENGKNVYKIHPALPWYLRQRLSELYSEEVINELEKKLWIFYALLAEKCYGELNNQAELATTALLVEEPNLLQSLQLAEQQQAWKEVNAILRALENVYERIGYKWEFKPLRQRVLNQIGIHSKEAKTKGRDAFNLWLYLRQVDGDEALQVHDLKMAEQIHEELLEELTTTLEDPTLNSPSINDFVGATYHNLGMLAQEQRQFKRAEEYYQKALQISEVARNFHSAAINYHQLGSLANTQKRFKIASNYYQNALKIFEDEGDFYHAATVYLNLGILAHKQLNIDKAKEYYEKSLEICEDEGYLNIAIDNYHQLGMIAEEQEEFDNALAYFRQALQIKEDTNDFYGAASTYHQLGTLLHKIEQFEDAISYYQKARQIFEEAKDFYSASYPCCKLGEIAKEQRDFETAIDYFSEVFKVCTDNEDWVRGSAILNSWSEILVVQEKWDEAIATYIKSIKVLSNTGDDYKENWTISPLYEQHINALGQILKVLGEKQFKIIVCKITNDEYFRKLRKILKSSGFSLARNKKSFLSKFFRIFC